MCGYTYERYSNMYQHVIMFATNGLQMYSITGERQRSGEDIRKSGDEDVVLLDTTPRVSIPLLIRSWIQVREKAVWSNKKGRSQ